MTVTRSHFGFSLPEHILATVRVFIAQTKPSRVSVFGFSIKAEAGIRMFSIICPQNFLIFLSRLYPSLVASGTLRFGT
jgi:hypothetical protein